MARYRKVDPRIWNDAKFMRMSDAGKLAFLFILTHPHMTALGAMRATIPGLAAELGWQLKAFREAFREALREGMLEHCESASFVGLPNFIKYNRPESPNVVTAWVGAADLLPECHAKWLCLQRAKGFAEAFGEAFGEAFAEAFAKAMPYQEQEQEQEQEEEGCTEPPIAVSVPPSPTLLEFPVRAHRKGMSVAWVLTEDKFRQYRDTFDNLDAMAELRKALQWCRDNPAKRKTCVGMPAFLTRWLTRASDNGRMGNDRAAADAAELARMKRAGHRPEPEGVDDV